MIHPTEGRILVNKIDRETTTEGGILLPGQTLQEESLYYGEVISEGHKTFPKGTKIFYSRYSATSVRDTEEAKKDIGIYYIISDLDIMAVEK